MEGGPHRAHVLTQELKLMNNEFTSNSLTTAVVQCCRGVVLGARRADSGSPDHVLVGREGEVVKEDCF